MNLDYWEEQIKATIAMAAHLAVPVNLAEQAYLPIVLESFQGQEALGQPNIKRSGCFREQVLPEGR
jgi:hypothetical protein